MPFIKNLQDILKYKKSSSYLLFYRLFPNFCCLGWFILTEGFLKAFAPLECMIYETVPMNKIRNGLQHVCQCGYVGSLHVGGGFYIKITGNLYFSNNSVPLIKSGYLTQ